MTKLQIRLKILFYKQNLLENVYSHNELFEIAILLYDEALNENFKKVYCFLKKMVREYLAQIKAIQPIRIEEIIKANKEELLDILNLLIEGINNELRKN